MAIKPVLVYRNPDSTADLNSRAARILDRGIFDGGQLSPSGISMTVDTAPFIAVGFDGMVAISDATEGLSVPVPAAGTEVSYLILHLEYRSLTTSIANLQIVPETTWTTSISKEFFVTFAKFTVDAGSTAMTDPGVAIDYSVGDWAEKAGKAGWRSPVADFASLPDPTAVVTGPNLGNRDGDVRLTLDTGTMYTWDETAGLWSPIGGSVDLREAIARGDEFDNHVLRSWNGSGLVGTTNNDLGGDGKNKNFKNGVPWIQQPSLAQRIDVAPLTAVLNGHMVKTVYTEINLPAPAALRYDVVWLEVWREALVTDVASETYPNDPTVGGTSTFAQLRAHFETLLEQRLTPNMGFSKIEIVDATTIVATRWRIHAEAGVSSLSINDSSQAAITATNIDAVPFTILSTQNDQRIWRASPAASTYDDMSWAIPLMIIRRTLSEVGPTSYIQEHRFDDNNDRYIFDVAPRAEGGMGLVEATQGVESGEGPSRISSEKTQLPTGWLGGFETEIVSPFAGSISVPEGSFRAQGRTLSPIGGSASIVDLPVAPAAGSRRDLVYLEVEATTHTPGTIIYQGPTETARYDRAGLRTRYWVARFVVADVGSDDTEAAAMATAGFTLGSVSDPVSWRRSATDDEDNSYSGSVYAIPVALIHRRNTQAYDPTTADGRNGADRSGLPGLPDNSSEQPYDYEILDLRRRVVHTDGEMNMILEESFDKLLRGELRTKFGDDVHDPGGRVVGTQILQVDRIFAGGSGGGYFSPNPAPDDRTGVWSESNEAEVLCWTTPNDLSITQTDPTGVFAYKPSEITINAPPGHHLSFDQDIYGIGGIGNVAPGGVSFMANEPAAVGVQRNLRGATFTFPPLFTMTDAAGNLTSVTWSISLPAGITDTDATAYVQTWAVRPNRNVDPFYSTNESLFSVPDIVYRADLNGTRVNIGPIVKTMSVTITADLFGGGRHGAVITDIDLAAAFPELGATPKMYGVSRTYIRGASVFDSGSKYSLAFVRLTDPAGASAGLDRMELEFTSVTPTGGVADVTVMCDGADLNQWVEIVPGSKQVRGVYSWAFGDIDFVGGSASHPGVAPTANHGNSTAFATVVPFSEVDLNPRGISTTDGANDSTNAEYLAYSISGTSYEYWTDSANLPPGWFGAPSLTAAAFEDSAATVPVNGGGYNPCFSVHDPAHGGSPDLRVTGVQKRPLVVGDDLRLFYLYTPYQGITSNLEDYLHGHVQAVGDQFLITAGTGLSHQHPRNVSRTLLGNPQGTLQLTSQIDIGHPGCTGILLPSIGDKTSLVRPDSEGESLRNTDGNLFAATTRLPFPFTPAVTGFPFAHESQVDYRAIQIGNDSFESRDTSLQHLSTLEATAIPGASPWIFEDAGAGHLRWRSQTANRILAFPIRAPSGSAITGVWADVDSLGPDGILTVTVAKRAKSLPGYLTASGMVGLVPIDASQPYQGYVPAIGMYPSAVSVDSDSDYYVIIDPNTSNLIVYGITVGILTLGASFLGETIQRVDLKRYSSNTSSAADLLGPTSVFDDLSDATFFFSSLISDWVSDGKVDYPLAPPRGRTLSLDLSGTVLFGNDFYGYVVGSEGFTRRKSVEEANVSSSGPYAGQPDMPKAYNTPTVPFITLEDADATTYPGGVVVAVPFVVKNSLGEAIMGVSVGVSPSSFKVVFPGSTVDAFYPAGRPVFRRGY